MAPSGLGWGGVGWNKGEARPQVSELSELVRWARGFRAGMALSPLALKDHLPGHAALQLVQLMTGAGLPGRHNNKEPAC